MKFLPYGENALLVNFEQRISASINQKVYTLNDKVKKTKGVKSTIPAYSSLTIIYDRDITDLNTLKDQISSFDLSEKSRKDSRIITIPVCYADEYALDLDYLAKLFKLDKEKIIDLHCSQEYRVYMMGFLPGFGYLGQLPEQLKAPRRPNPRKQVPERSVAIAGSQTGIYPFEAPGGWQIIGKTPIPLIDKKYRYDFLLQAGDFVRFTQINEKELKKKHEQVKTGVFNFEQLYG